MCEEARNNGKRKKRSEMVMAMSKGKGVVEGEIGRLLLPRLSTNHVIRGESNGS